ncbi:MAG TPA: tetratricopeptide repeat protein [Tepidisphaeraceae bacterium]|nr:tetratricopeptide repeat protein [Tepidisphaeraceae bacterium]
MIIRAIKTVLAFLGWLIVILFCASAAGQTAPVATDVASKAYQLRMQGKVDDAKSFLEQSLRENPGDAQANYELARTLMHMALSMRGGMAGLINDLNQAHEAIARAEAIDPNDVKYPFFDGQIALLQAYPSLMRDQPDSRAKVQIVCKDYEAALKIKPDYSQAMLYLVEIYAALPEKQGGSTIKAREYSDRLSNIDPIYTAKAKSLLLGEQNTFEYWQDVLTNHPQNVQVLEELGKAYLRAERVNDAADCFTKAIKIDPTMNYLYLDLSIYHAWAAMRAGEGTEAFKNAVTAGDAAVEKYLATNPSVPMRAYALGVRYKYLAHSGRQQEAEKALAEATRLDRYFSKATGLPTPDLFIPPDQISTNHRYYFRSIQ